MLTARTVASIATSADGMSAWFHHRAERAMEYGDGNTAEAIPCQHIRADWSRRALVARLRLLHGVSRREAEAMLSSCD